MCAVNLDKDISIARIERELLDGVACVQTDGVWGSFGPLLVSWLAKRLDRPILYIRPHLDDVHRLADDITTFGIKDHDLLPAWEGVGKPAIAVAGNDSWMINPNISPEKKAAAMVWFDYQRSYQAQFNELYLEGNESIMTAVYEHPEVKAEVKRPDLRSATVAAQIGESYPPGMMDVLSIMMEYLHNVALGNMDADEALEKAQAEIDMIM